MPLTHPPGQAQCDFGEAWVVIGGVEQKAHYIAMDLPHSDACYVKAYPAETTEAFCDGHVSAFVFLGGVPQSILYDNTTLAVARILGDGRCQRTRCSPSCSPTTCSMTGLAVRAREMIRGRWKVWWGMLAGTSWYPSGTHPLFRELRGPEGLPGGAVPQAARCPSARS